MPERNIVSGGLFTTTQSTALTSYHSLPVWDADLRSATEISETVISDLGMNRCARRVCLAAVELRVEGSLPEPGPEARVDPYL